MLTINFLEEHDKITPDCWFRPLNLISHLDDSVPETSTYSGSPINNLLWLLVGKFAPGYIGKTVLSINTPAKSNCYSDQKFYYEFIIGIPPTQSIHSANFDKQIQRKLLKGKYKGLTIEELMEKDKPYLKWYDHTIQSYSSKDLTDYNPENLVQKFQHEQPRSSSIYARLE